VTGTGCFYPTKRPDADRLRNYAAARATYERLFRSARRGPHFPTVLVSGFH